MEWFLIIGGIVALLAWNGRRHRTKAATAPSKTSKSEPNFRLSATVNTRHSFENSHSTRKSSIPARWVQPGEAVKIGAYRMDSGMFYLGGILPGQHQRQVGNCVVDPTAKVAGSGNDRAGTSMPYWPSYQGIDPIARRTYLEWLAGGRKDPDIGIGYVFLFFYGLERRLFVDNDRAEASLLIAEVQRLVEQHGSNSSFKNYATRFLDAASVTSSSTPERPTVSPDLRTGYEMPLAARVYLGEKLATEVPLDAGDALMWVLSLPDTSLRTPATRCFEELRQLWEHRFAVRYPNGLKINAPKTRLKLEYRAASGAFAVQIDAIGSTGRLPDIAAISAPITGLRDMLSACTEELAPYSRLLGKRPDARGTLDAAMLLPKELAIPAQNSEVSQRLDLLFGGRTVASVTVAQLTTALSIDLSGVEKVSTTTGNQIGGYLDHLNIGFEPDRRYGSSPLRPKGHVVMFKAQGGGQVDGEAPAFSSARAMVDVAALAAGADDKVDSAETDAIMTEIRNVPELSKVERARLIAYASTLLKDTSLHHFALQKLKSLDAAAKQSVIKSATAAIMADGYASPAEVKFLERLYKAMALPIDGVYSMLHRGAVVVDEPVSVAQEQRSAGIPIPKQTTAAPSSTIQIDHNRLERLRSETSAVSALLAGIFVEEETASSPSSIVVSPVHQEASQFAGLDAAHAALLEEVLCDGSLSRELFDDAARNLRLLPDGAIERINDWGFDQFEESILEGDDELTIAPHILAELTGTEVAA